MDRQQEILYTLTLSLIPQVGNVTFEQLVNLFKSPKNVLNATKGDFKAHKCNTLIINNILNNKDQALATAEKELNFIEKNNIQAILKTDSDYPYRLQQCHGAPNILFGLGNFKSNQKHCIAIVGTRRCTDYGKKMVEKIVGELSESISNLQIISGLASGIDTYAHQAAVNNNVETIGILGNGLNRIYPAANKRLAQQMLENGGLLTEYFSTIADIDATNFAMRNRIIAGMSDCIVVAEAPQRSGALITAKYGQAYDRTIFALPGKTTDLTSEGCNYIIRENIACLVTNTTDILKEMNWDLFSSKTQISTKTQKPAKITRNLDSIEQQIVTQLQNKGQLNIDELCLETNINISVLTKTLLSLEFDDILECLPGKRYQLK